MRKFIEVVVAIASVLGLGLSIFLACRLLPNTGELTFDYQAIIVALMEGLFTLVVGWNIYTGLEYKSYGTRYEELAQRIEAESVRLQKEVEHNIGIIRGNEAHLLAAMFALNDKVIQKHSMLIHLVAALKRIDIPENADLANGFIRAVMTGLHNTREIKLSPEKVNKLVLEAGKIKNPELLNEFDALIEAIQDCAERKTAK